MRPYLPLSWVFLKELSQEKYPQLSQNVKFISWDIPPCICHQLWLETLSIIDYVQELVEYGDFQMTSSTLTGESCLLPKPEVTVRYQWFLVDLQKDMNP